MVSVGPISCDIHNFDLERPAFGNGSYGKVYLGRDMKAEGTPKYAIKELTAHDSSEKVSNMIYAVIIKCNKIETYSCSSLL